MGITQISKICSLNIKIVLFTGTGGGYSEVYPCFGFFGIFWEIFLAELYGWLTLDERAFARLYPGNHELAVSPGTVSPRSKEATVSSEITLLLTRGLSVQSINISFDAPRGTLFANHLRVGDQNGQVRKL